MARNRGQPRQHRPANTIQQSDQSDDYRLSTIAGIVGGIVLGVSVFLPWDYKIESSVFGGQTTLSVTGIDVTAGIFALLIAGLAIAAFFLGDSAGEHSLSGIILGGLGSLLVLMMFSGGDNPAFGLVVAAVGCLQLLLAGLGNAIAFVRGAGSSSNQNQATQRRVR